jgi:ankyrin repeat protein
MLCAMNRWVRGLAALLAGGVVAGCGAVPDKQTPLHTAVYDGDTAMAMAILDDGADVNLRDEGGGTPLHVAVALGNTEMARELLRRGADVHARDLDGDTPLDFTRNATMRRLLMSTRNAL